MESSPLQRLPPELRNQIFALALAASHSIDLKKIHEGVALLRTCKQTREETYAMFYAGNDFRYVFVQNSDDGVKKLCGFLHRLGPSMIRIMGSLRVAILPPWCTRLDANYSRSEGKYNLSIDVAQEQLEEIFGIYGKMGVKLEMDHPQFAEYGCVCTFRVEKARIQTQGF